MGCKKVIPLKDIPLFNRKVRSMQYYSTKNKHDVRRNPFSLKKEVPYHYRVFTVYCKLSFMIHPATNKVFGQVYTLSDLGTVLSDSNIKYLRDYRYYRYRKTNTLMNISKNKNRPLFYLLTDKKKGGNR